MGSDEIVVEGQGLSVGYSDVAILEGLTFSLPVDSMLVVLGHNGSGKTTLLRTLFGLLPAISGRALVLGLSARNTPTNALIRNGARFLAQGERAFRTLTVKHHRRVLHRLYSVEEDGDVNDFPRSYEANKRVGQLSVGQRRLEALDLLTNGQPRLLILDEPLAGLDVEFQEKIVDLLKDIRRRGGSLLVVEHNFRILLELADTAMVLRQGQMSYLGRASALRDEQTLASVYL